MVNRSRVSVGALGISDWSYVNQLGDCSPYQSQKCSMVLVYMYHDLATKLGDFGRSGKCWCASSSAWSKLSQLELMVELSN